MNALYSETEILYVSIHILCVLTVCASCCFRQRTQHHQMKWLCSSPVEQQETPKWLLIHSQVVALDTSSLQGAADAFSPLPSVLCRSVGMIFFQLGGFFSFLCFVFDCCSLSTARQNFILVCTKHHWLYVEAFVVILPKVELGFVDLFMLLGGAAIHTLLYEGKQLRSSICAHAFHLKDCKDPDVHVPWHVNAYCRNTIITKGRILKPLMLERNKNHILVIGEQKKKKRRDDEIFCTFLSPTPM